MDLDEVQVTAHRRLVDTGVQKTVLDTAILHQNVALSMSDILTQHSTLFIKSYGRATESTAEFRGTSPSHTQVLWNGMKINSPMLGTVDFSIIPAYFVDQANLLHGASSLTLTGGGLGGAVDMHTLPLFGQGYALQYIQGIGSFGTYDQFLRFTYGNDRWSSSTRLVYSTSDNDFKYTNYDKKRWERAKAAADEFMTQQMSNGYYALVQATPDANGEITPRSYRLAYRKGYFERGSSEVIISIRKSNKTDYHDKHIDVQDDYGCGATLNWVNKFPWADGTPFPEDFDWSHKANWTNYPFFKPDPTGAIKIPGIETRDPRLYENICVPGDVWRDGTVGRAYDNHANHQDGCPGFLMMKYVLQQNSDRNMPPHWCMMRFAEVLMNAAEAYNEADGGPSVKAYAWVNAVRERVGLPGLKEGMTQDEFRKALLLERELEFGFEEFRWFDMVRYGLTEAFTTPLKGLTSIGDKQREATVFDFEVKDAYPPRVWYTTWDTKWYLAPIPAKEINKGYGMTQNPGW